MVGNTALQVPGISQYYIKSTGHYYTNLLALFSKICLPKVHIPICLHSFMEKHFMCED